ncbi:MAG: flagellar protein FlaB [Proteobacteria bacterium]|nr:flagellar protein FlaB [Pseudomonadota bacterium]MBU1546598.1 flagellar protein FlaB [Pseudomonadota bacterium]MBU2620681.1 flagellar protein FlaB [Pseudomonadota bacterium]
MALRINTNIAALTAHTNMIKNDNGLSASLERLSSGLRINRAADDASGMAIADALKSQVLGLGQAVRNANDGISMVQTADGALDESIKIVNTIKTKAIQAAQDGQTTDSRKAIQSDITKLLEELDIIAKTTAFNGQKLLSGNFTNKKFQVGAYSGETVSISIGSSESTKVGHISASTLTFGGEGTAELAIYSNLQNQTYTLNSVEIAYDNTRENSLGAVADAINKLSDVLGITAAASVSKTTDNNIVAGTTDSTFAINGVNIGAVAVSENDADGALVSAINQKTDQHGVFASVDQEGKLTLTSNDQRAIEVTQGTATTTVLGNTASMSTLGQITLTQQGTGEIVINNRAGGQAVALLDNALELTGVTTTTVSSTLASGSSIAAASTIGANSTLKVGTALVAISGAVFTTGSSTIGSGSVLNSGTMIAAGTTLEGDLTNSGAITATGTLGSGSTIASGTVIGLGTTLQGTFSDGLLAGVTTAVTTLATGSIISSGTIAVGSSMLTADYTANSATIDASGTSVSGLYTIITSGGGISGPTTFTNGGATLAIGSSLLSSGQSFTAGSSLGVNFTTSGATVTTTADMTLTTGTVIASGSVLTEDTSLSANAYVGAGTTFTLTADMTLAAGSNLTTSGTLGDDTTLSNAWYNTGAISVAGGSMTLGANSSLATASVLAEGSSIGGTVTLANAETVDSATDMRLAGGSTLASGSTITAGTFLTNDVVANDGVTYRAGAALAADIVTSGSTSITKTMTLNGGSILAAGSTLAANSVAAENAAIGSTSAAVASRLSDVNVTSQAGAQTAIAVADAALKGLDKVRSDLGSVQNQLVSTIANLSATKVNIAAAESSIRDVDFAEEAANFSKMQILNQASSFAMAQANASSQTVLSLLQG